MGVDPGTTVLGYGIIDNSGDQLSLVICDVIKCQSRSAMGERLLFIYQGLCEIIQQFSPDAIAIETPFVADNSRTALVIGKAQAIALLAAASNHVPAYEYSPAAIKYHAASHGNSSKEQVQKMVKLQLNLGHTRLQADSADALAAAICHLRQSHINNITGGGK